MMRFWGRAVAVGVAGLLLFACSAQPKKPDAGAAAGADETAMAGADTNGAESAGAEGTGGFGGMPMAGAGAAAGTGMDLLKDPNSLLAKRVIYFDYDSSVVRDEFSTVVEAHAGFLAEHPSVKVTLEGHGDERGTREYNLGLGERRAQAVQQFLLLMGASQSQIQTVSYGEERPLDSGHDEEAWQKNRRVEIVYPPQ
jgi:peptidoglycan-associated lipoprotein